MTEGVDAWQTLLTREFILYVIMFLLVLIGSLFAIATFGLNRGWSLLLGIVGGMFLKSVGDWLKAESWDRASGEK